MLRTDAGGVRLLFPSLAHLYAVAAPLAYTALRVILGGTLVTHGVPKLIGAAHGSMLDPMAASTSLIANVLHLPAAAILAGFVACLETFGGIALAVGFLTRIVAAMFAIQMAVICVALGPTWPWIDRGFEYPFVAGAALLHVAFTGGGRFSVDRVLGREV